jgi:hypothetical protein
MAIALLFTVSAFQKRREGRWHFQPNIPSVSP